MVSVYERFTVPLLHESPTGEYSKQTTEQTVGKARFKRGTLTTYEQLYRNYTILFAAENMSNEHTVGSYLDNRVSNVEHAQRQQPGVVSFNVIIQLHHFRPHSLSAVSADNILFTAVRCRTSMDAFDRQLRDTAATTIIIYINITIIIIINTIINIIIIIIIIIIEVVQSTYTKERACEPSCRGIRTLPPF